MTIDVPLKVIGKFCMSCPSFEFLDGMVYANDDIVAVGFSKCAHYDQCKRAVDGYLREHPQEKHPAK